MKIHDELLESFPKYVDEVLIPEILSKFKRKPEHLGRRGPQERIEPEKDVNDYAPVLPEKSVRVVKLKDVEKVIGSMTTIMDGIRAASFVPHDGAPIKVKRSTMAKQLDTAIQALEAISILGSGEVEELLIGNEMAQTAMDKIQALDLGPVFPGPEKERSGTDQIRATQVIQNNATVDRKND